MPNGQEKVAVPEVPNLELLNYLTSEVMVGTAATKLASAGWNPQTRDDLDSMLETGHIVSEAIASQTPRQQNKFASHRNTVAEYLGMIQGADEAQQFANHFARKDVVEKFASAF